MKKVIKKILLIGVIIIVLSLISNILKTKHNINYEVKTGKKKYIINEIYKDKKYLYKIKYQKEEFIFSEDNIFNKNKKTIKKIYSYETDNLKCIYPAYEESNVICKKDDLYYSYALIKEEIKPFIAKLKKLGYKNNSWQEKDETTNFSDLKIHNIEKDTYIYIWNHDEIYWLTKDQYKKIPVLEKDTYINKLGVLVDKYYVFPNYDQKYEFDEILVFDITNNKKKVIKLKTPISFDSYINGVYEDKIYLFDMENLIQYEINPKNKKCIKVGDKNNPGIIYENDKIIEKNIYELKDKIYFKKEYDVDIDGSNILNYKDSYFYTKDDNLYKYNSFDKTTTIMYNEKVEDIKLVNNDLYFIKSDTLYRLNNNIYKVLEYDEFKFNNENRITIYKKK